MTSFITKKKKIKYKTFSSSNKLKHVYSQLEKIK